MADNILKTGIYTNETVVRETLEQPIDADFSLPDYYGDIRKILKCKAVSGITSKSLSGKTVSIEGVITVTVFYCDEDGKINSFEYPYSYQKTKEINGDTEDAILRASAKCEYINCRAVTGRKIDIHGAVSIKIAVIKKRKKDVISDIDDRNIEILRCTAPATTPTGFAEKYLFVEEECEIGSENGGDILLRYDTDACIKECKTVSGKVIVKGELTVNTRFSENGCIKCMKTAVPYSQIIEIDTAGEGCESDAKVQICFADIKPRTDNDGKFKTVSLNAKLLISAETYCKNDIALIADAYSKKQKAKIETETVKVSRIYEKINECFNCKKTVETDDIKISSVLDDWYEVRVTETKISSDSLNTSGTVTACFIVEEESGDSSYFEKIIDFKYKYPLNSNSDNLTAQPQITLNSCGYTILSEKSLDIHLELTISAVIYEQNELSAVTGISIDEEKNEECNNDNAMVVYFAEKGEKLWDIAKKYFASIEEIKTLNDISADVLENNMTILLPIK